MSLTFDEARRRRGFLALLGLLMAATPALAFGQAQEARTLLDIKALSGEVVAESTPDSVDVVDTTQALTGYRVRHVAWRNPWLVNLEGRRTRVREAWHVQVFFARPLSVRNQAFSLVVDGRWCGFLAEAPDLRSADAVCFDPGLMRTGASLAASYRSVVIARPSDDEEWVAPEADFEGAASEPMYVAAAPLQMKEVR
jgi:hypothetical protein